jgi:glutathione S-transferase
MLTLVIGNKNYSSWSLRPCIAMTAAGIPFTERLVPFETPEFNREAGPAAKVPLLIDGDIRVWESLAILEYLAETFPAAKLWPADVAARAHARAIASEMHAGFSALRGHLPVNFARRIIKRPPTPAVAADVARIEAMWAECRARSGGPFLFGTTFGNADAMYAPVVSRFITYDVDVTAQSRAYMDAVTALPAWRQWRDAAIVEPWLFADDEVDWPQVHRADGRTMNT